MKINNIISCLILSMLILSCSGNGMMRDFEDILDDSDNGNMDKIQLVLGTYNLRLQTGSDADQRNWENRKQWVRKIVDDYDFDILSTQEGYLGQINDVVENKDYGYVAVGRDDGVNSGETCGILYKKARFGVEAQGTFWLSETPNAPSYGWGAEIRRICTWIKFKEKESGRIFFVFNVHYDHQSVTARDESSKLILNRIKQIAGDFPTVMTGDLNSEPTTEAVKILTESNVLWDSKTVTATPALGPEGTYYGYDLSKTPTSRIDYIFVTKAVDVLNYEVVNDDFTTGNIASDHLPVRVKIEL